jgi:hypothetical protein
LCTDWLAAEQTFDVLGQTTGRGIAPQGISLQRLEDDRIKITSNLLARDVVQRNRSCGTRWRTDPARWRASTAVVDAFPGNDFPKQHAQRVDIGGRGGRAAALLLRGGIGRSERRHLRVRALAIFRQQLGNAEVEQLDFAVLRDQDVGGLEVTMHDQCAMRGFNGEANHGEQVQTPAQAELVGAHVIGDGAADDEFQCNVGQAGFVDATFDHARDVGMPQLDQGMLFAPKRALRIRAVQAAPHQLQGDMLGDALDFADGVEHG